MSCIRFLCVQAAVAEVDTMANSWVERLRNLGRSRQAAADLLRRIGSKPPTTNAEAFSFWVVSQRRGVHGLKSVCARHGAALRRVCPHCSRIKNVLHAWLGMP